MTIPMALVGIGKIARDQHIPAIMANPDFSLVAAVSRHGKVDGVPNFADFDTFLAEGPQAAIALCTPPDIRLEISLKAIAAGRDLLIEKPPAATLGEIETIISAARDAGVVLFATWHSRFAPAVARARAWIAGRTCVDAPLDASGILGTVGHVIRCGRVSGLEDTACHAPRAFMEICRSGPVRLPALKGAPSGMLVCPTRSLDRMPLRFLAPPTSGDTPTTMAYAAAIAGSL